MHTKLVSVIMSTYNEEKEWLIESIESILHQTYTNLEFIIVVDNPLNYELIEIIEKYKHLDQRIKVIINKENKGLIYSLNTALAHANGDYIARMDADDISHAQRLEKQLHYLETHHLDLIGANINLFNEKDGIFFTTHKLITHKYLKKILIKGTIGIVHPTFFAKKALFDTLEGYKDAALYTEDKELIARAICQHFKMGNIDEVLLDCRYSNHSITKTNALYINKIGTYISDIFKQCIQNKKAYIFNENIFDTINITKKETEAYNKAQILKTTARKNLHNHQYIQFFIHILQAFYLSKEQIIDAITINMYLKWYALLERIELRYYPKL